MRSALPFKNNDLADLIRPMSQIEHYDLVFLTIPWIAWLTWELLDRARAFDTGTWKYPIPLARSRLFL